MNEVALFFVVVTSVPELGLGGALEPEDSRIMTPAKSLLVGFVHVKVTEASVTEDALGEVTASGGVAVTTLTALE